MTCQELIAYYGYYLNQSAYFQQLANQSQQTANDYYLQAEAQGCFGSLTAGGEAGRPRQPTPEEWMEFRRDLEECGKRFADRFGFQ